MNLQLDMTERQLKLGIVQLGVTLAILLLGGTFLMSLIIPLDSGLSSVPINALLFALAFSILASGVRSFLSVIDWFHERRKLREVNNG